MNDQDKTKEELIDELQKLRKENNSLKTSHQINIAERNLAVELISDKAKSLEDAQKLAMIGSWKSDITTNIVEWSTELCRINGYDPKLTVPSFSEMSRFFTPESWDRLNMAVINAINNGEPYELDLKQVRADGAIFHTTARGVPDYDDSGKMIGLHGTVQDITKQKEAEEVLCQSEELLSLFMKFSPIYSYIKEVSPTESRVLKASENYFNMIGISGSEMVGKTMHELFPAEFSDKISADDWNVVSTGKPIILEEELNGRFYTTFKYPITKHGRNLLAGYTLDTTERKLADEKIREVLEEKESLLHEVHHRVKNNLQVIIALIKMRTRSTKNAGTVKFLQELENQVHSMALVYEQLYQSENLKQVGMTKYLQLLTANVLDTYGRRDAVQFHLDVPLSLDVALATPCGLIVNELFSNILKHAFPPGFRGKPTVSISMRQDDETIQLTVSDNGVGFPPGYDWRKCESMGLNLVKLWVEHQLGGTIAVSGKSGTTFSVKFNLKD